MFLFCIMLTLLSLSISEYTTILHQVLIDHLIDKETTYFVNDIVTLLVVTFFSLCTYGISELVKEGYLIKIIEDIRNEAFRGLLNRSLEKSNQMETGDCISILTNDIAEIKGSCLGLLFFLITNICALTTSLVVMCYYQPIVAVVVILMGLLTIFLPVKMGERVKKLQKARAEKNAEFISVIQEFLKGYEVITSFGISRLIYEKYKRKNGEVVKEEKKVRYNHVGVDGVAQLVGAMSGSLIISLSAIFVMKGKMSIGELAVFTTLQANFSAALQMIYRVIPSLKGSKSVFDRVNALVDIKKEEGKKELSEFKNYIEMKNVFYNYNNEKEVLKGINYKFEKGKKYAVIGENGSGKTTLGRVLAKYSDNYAGNILYDGIELREIKDSNIHNTVALIHQNVFLFNESILYNITLGEEFSKKEIDDVIKMCGVDKIIEEVSEGINYIVGEDGSNLSGGQKQRIILARAMIRKTKVIIMDEGTSAMDEKTSKVIENAILSQDVTLISITHNCLKEHLDLFDIVLKMEKGQIMEI